MADLSALIAKYDKRIDALVDVVDEAASEIQIRTPVDTGVARKGWKRTEADGYIYWTNGVDYIRALEYGHSKQAPRGMVRITLAELPAKARAALNGL